MIKLKRILIEGLERIDVPVGQIPVDVAFTLSETDPWEYMLKSADKTLYTRKKGEKQWRPMKDVAANFNLAKQRISDMDKFKTGSSVKDKTSLPDKDKTKELAADYKIQTNIALKLRDMISKNPEKYFSKFKTIVDDNELGASAYFKKQQTVFEAQLANIKNKDNEDIALNTKLIKNIMNDTYKSIKNNSQIKKSIQLTDPTYKSNSSYERYRTLTVQIWWQYFNN